MAPKNKDDNFMDVDSDSDISLLGDVEHRVKGKGKGKVIDKRKKDKGKAKAKDVSGALPYLRHSLIIHMFTASLYLGGILYAFLGHCTGR
jgi:hypothetical protein